MKKILFTLGLLLLFATQANAACTNTNTCMRMDNGTYMNLNGQRMNYSNCACKATSQQALNYSLRMFDNAASWGNNQTETAAQKAEWAKKKAQENSLYTIYPIMKTIRETQNSYQQELRQLEAKADVGVTVDKSRTALLDYKINVLKNLEDNGLYLSLRDSVNAVGKREGVPSVYDIKTRYINLTNALNAKTITQAEFDEVKLKIDKDYELFEKTYNKIVAINYTPSYPWQFWADHNLSRTSSITNNLSIPANEKDGKVMKFGKGVANFLLTPPQ